MVSTRSLVESWGKVYGVAEFEMPRITSGSSADRRKLRMMVAIAIKMSH
jgi:hypothetical protein